MKTKKIEVRHLNLPMVNAFTTSFGTVDSRHIVIAKFHTDIGVTYAESPTLHAPMYTEETTWTVMHMLKEYIGPLMINQDIKNPEELHRRLLGIKRNNMAKHVADTAMHHLLSEAQEIPLHQYLGGTKTEIEAGLSIGIEKSLDMLLDRVGWAINEGFRRIKIKIKPGWDVEPISAIRKKYGDVPLMVDANSAYMLSDVAVFHELDQYGLMMIEQPLADDDIIEHSSLQRLIRTPICLDESIVTYDDARHAIEMNSCRIINIKPGRVGGLYPSKRIHDLCYNSPEKIPVWVGGMSESAIGKLDNIAVATLPGFSLPGDIGPSHWYFQEDLIDPSFEVQKGIIVVPKKPGLGYAVDERRIEKYTVDKFVIE